MNNPLALVKRRFETFLYVPGRRAMLSAEQRAKRFFRGRVAAILLCALAFLALHPAKAGSDLPVPDGWTKTWEDGATSIELSHATRNWSDFSIGNGFAVRFTGSGTAVNKVTGGVRSDIFGTLTGDKVYILNPNGILFGSSARVDVNGLVAAAAGAVENGADGMVFSKLGSGSVVNQGTINAGKFAYLVGKSVENAGSIRAGEVALAAFGGTGAESLTIASAPNGATITFDIPEDAAPADEEEGDGVVSSGSLAGSEDAKAQGRDPILRASNPTDVGTPDGDGNINVTMSGSNIKVEEDIVGKNVNLRATQYINVGKADGSVQASVTATEGDIELASDGNVNVWGDLTANNGNITLTASGAGKSVKIGSTDGPSVTVVAGGDITLDSNRSAQIQNGSTVESTGGNVQLTGGAYVLVDEDATAKASAGSVSINVGTEGTPGEFVGIKGAIDAKNISIDAVTGENLTEAPTVTAYSEKTTADAAGVFVDGALSNAESVTIKAAGGSILNNAGISASETVSLSAKEVSGSGTVDSGALGVVVGSFEGQKTKVSTIAIEATAADGVIDIDNTLDDNDFALEVGTVGTVSGLKTAGGDISVTAGGAITVSQAVNANGGNVMLDAGNNAISILANTSGENVTLKSEATVGSDTIAANLTATVAGGTIDASDQTLTLKKGEVSGEEIKVGTFNVDGGTVSAGSIKATTKVDQTGGEITAVMIDGAVAVDGDDSVLATSKIDGDLVQNGGEIRGLGAIVSDGPGDPEPPTIEITGAVTQSGGTLGNVAATDNVIIDGLLTQDGDDASIVAKKLSLKGGATQTAGMVEADEISLENADADVSLAQSGNKIGTVGGSAKELDLVDSDGGLVLAEIGAAKLTIKTAGAMTQVEGKTVTATAGDIVFSADAIETSGAIEATAGDVRLLAGNGATIGGTVSASSGNIRIDAGEGALAVNKAVGGQNVTLFAEGDITEGAAVGATADKLVESASGNIVVNEAGTVGGKGAYLAESGSITVAAGKTLAAGDLLYVKANTVSGSVSASDLIVETGSGNAVRAAGGTIAYETGKTTVSGATKVAASTADDLVVDSGTSALEVGAFDAAAADVAITEVAPDKTPDHPAGTMDRTLVASGAGALEGIAAKSVDIDAGNVTVGKSVTATDGNISISGTGISVNDALEAAGNTVELDAGTGNVEIAANVTAETLELKSATEIKSGTTGVTTLDATGKTLTVSGTGDIDVGETLTAATLDVDAGTVDAKNVQAAVDQDGGQITVAETITGAVGQKGATEAVTLSAKKIDGKLAQEEGNAGVVTVGNVTGATVQNGGKILKHADAEQLKFDSTVTQNGGTIASEADNVHIFDKFTQSGGTLNASQLQFSRNAEQTAAAGTVNAAAILLPGGGSDVTLDKGGNKIGKLSGTVRNLAIRDTAGGLVVGNDGGKVEALGTVTLEATAGDITQEANLVASGLTTLTAKNVNLANSEWNSFNGGVAATATADNGDVRIVHRNIGVAENLDVQGVEAGSDGKRGDILVKSINEGGIAVNGVVNGNNVTLKADKNISESAAVNADADKYVVSTGGNITVDNVEGTFAKGAYLAESETGTLTVKSGLTLSKPESADFLYVKASSVSGNVKDAISVEGSGDNATFVNTDGTRNSDAGKITISGATYVAATTDKDLVVDNGSAALTVGSTGGSGALSITEVKEVGTENVDIPGPGGDGVVGITAKSVDIDAGEVTVGQAVTATGGNIEIDGSGINVNASLTAEGNQITLDAGDSGSVTLAADVKTGTLLLKSSTQQADGKVLATTLSLDNGDAVVQLNSTENDFTSVQGTAANLTVKDGADGINLGNVTATEGNVTVDALNGGNIEVNAGATVKSETGDVTLTANGGATVSGTVQADAGSASVKAENVSAEVSATGLVTAKTAAEVTAKTAAEVKDGGQVVATGDGATATVGATGE